MTRSHVAASFAECSQSFVLKADRIRNRRPFNDDVDHNRLSPQLACNLCGSVADWPSNGAFQPDNLLVRSRQLRQVSDVPDVLAELSGHDDLLLRSQTGQFEFRRLGCQLRWLVSGLAALRKNAQSDHNSGQFQNVRSPLGGLFEMLLIS